MWIWRLCRFVVEIRLCALRGSLFPTRNFIARPGSAIAFDLLLLDSWADSGDAQVLGVAAMFRARFSWFGHFGFSPLLSLPPVFRMGWDGM